MRTQLQHLEAQVAHLKAEGEVEEELRLILGRLETFAAKVHDLTFRTPRDDNSRIFPEAF